MGPCRESLSTPKKKAGIELNLAKAWATIMSSSAQGCLTNALPRSGLLAGLALAGPPTQHLTNHPEAQALKAADPKHIYPEPVLNFNYSLDVRSRINLGPEPKIQSRNILKLASAKSP